MSADEKKLHLKIQMRFGDLDALNHVNNANYFTYFELGRIAFFREVLNGFDSNDVAFVVKFAEADFKAPLHFEDHPEIITWISEAGNSHCVFLHEVSDHVTGKVFATGKIVLVWIDESLKKTQIPASIKKQLLNSIP
ncbi:MAG: acyl-CoA thioesterase [Candidatus Thermoplasmatota archaeon]|jgi:acyl-CoA thioester hydrolase|nr:acyl-CoA thioesterase [Candidatus Thermoplasmatota archaeon]